MQLRAFAVILATCFVGIITWVFTPPALALTQIKLSNVSYHDCPAELSQGAVTSGATMAANCFIVTGKAETTPANQYTTLIFLGASTMPTTTR